MSRNIQNTCKLNGTGTSCKENFQTRFAVAGGGFISYWNHQLIKFGEKKRFKLKKKFCYYEKIEINTFENFPCKISLYISLS